VSLYVNCFYDFDDAVWYCSFKLPSHEGIKDKSYSETHSCSYYDSSVETHDVVGSKERRTNQHTEDSILNSHPDSIILVVYMVVKFINSFLLLARVKRFTRFWINLKVLIGCHVKLSNSCCIKTCLNSESIWTSKCN